jgi:hypothetical protein
MPLFGQRREVPLEDCRRNLEWKADAGSTRVEDGVDTFLFREGEIRAQTVRYTLIGA